MSARRLVLGVLFAFLLAASPPLARAAALSLVQVVQDSASGLSGASAVAVSPDGKNAYVTSSSGNSVAMFYRDLGANAFFYMGKLVDGVDADGLQGASAIAISPDGQSVYVTGTTANALAVFDRFPSGLLSFTGVLREGFDGVDGLAAPTGVAVGPTGRVFVSSSGDNALSAFDPSFPTLSQVGVWKNGDPNPLGGTISGLTGASGVVATQGQFGTDVYVSSATDSAIAVFTTNLLPPAFHESQVVQDGVGGFDGLAQAAGLALGADGHHLYVAGTGDSAVAILDRSPTTSLLSFNSLAKQGVAGVSGLGKVDSLCAEPSGESVYAGGGESTALFSFTPGVVALAVDAFDFGLDFVQSNPLPGFFTLGSSNVAVASLPDSSKILAAEALSSRRFFGGQLSIYDRDPSTGALTAQQTIPDGDGTIGVRGAQSIVASPDGRDAYVLGSDEAVTSSFRRDAATGTLSFTGFNRLSGDQSFQIAPPIRAAVMSPDGKNLYETAYRQFSLTAFQRDATTGLLLPTQVFHDTDVAAGLIRPTALAVSPDGKNVYVVGGNGSSDSAVAIFARDPSTGALTYHGADINGPGGLDGFIAPNAIAVSPDGKSVYVASYTQTNAITQFTRDPSTGDLGFFGFYTDPNQGSFAFGSSILVSADGRFVYVGSGRITVFQRNTFSGNLTQIDTSASLSGKYFLSLSPNGSQLYAAILGYTRPGGSLARFTRDAGTGLLTFAEALASTTPSDESLAGAVSAAVSPDSRFVYIAGYDGSAITVFAPEPGEALLAVAALAALLAQRRRR